MKKVLIVDDSPSVRQQVCMALNQAGFATVEAVDGLDGLAQSANTEISLVICDVNMPRMNGLEMVEKVKADPTRSTLPILTLTSEGQATLIERAKKAGAKGWIVKPFKADLLVAAVKKLIAA